MKKQLTEVQIIGFLGQAEASLPVKQLCLRQGFSEGIVNWLRAARSCPVKSTPDRSQEAHVTASHSTNARVRSTR